MTRSVLGEAGQARFDDARFGAVRRLGELAQRERCEFALVCGDVFESNQVDRRTVTRALDALGSFPCPVYLLPGNHDPLDAGSLYRGSAFRQAAPAHVRVIENAEPREVVPGVELVGAPWLSRRPERNPVVDALTDLGPVGPLRILAAHGVLDCLVSGRRDASSIALAPLERAVREDRLHYAALGDRHSLTRLLDGRVCYAGTPVSTDWGESEPGRALVVELDRDGARGHVHAIDDWRFAGPERARLEGESDLAALAERLESLPGKERSVLRLELAGALDLHAAARLAALLERMRDLFAGLDLRDSELRIGAADSDLDSLELAGFAERAALRLREESAGTGDTADVARDALALLVRLAEGADLGRGES